MMPLATCMHEAASVSDRACRAPLPKRCTFTVEAAVVHRTLSLLALAAACSRAPTDPSVAPPDPPEPPAPTPAAVPSLDAAVPEPDATAPEQDAFQPLSEAYVSRWPTKVADVKLDCLAANVGLGGVVVLKVEVRKDGSVRDVHVLESMSHGCTEVAVKALSRMRFNPAIDTRGAPTDFVIPRYEYEFRAAKPPIDPGAWVKWYLAELDRASASCRSAQNGDRHRCLCTAACELTPAVAPPNGAMSLRLPFVDIDGWTVDLQANGRARRCGLTKVGDPDAAFTTTCAAR